VSQVTPIMTSFNGGELGPRMLGRVDQAIYQISAAEMLNFVPTVEGPAVKRAGFRHIRASDLTATWLSTFIYSVTQAYVLEWGNLKLRFYTNGGRIESSPTVAYEVTTPYTAAEAPFVSQQQSYDRLYMAHSAHPPAALTRTGGATFSYGALTLKSGPFADQNVTESITVTAAGTFTVGGTVTLTATSAIFLSGHIGAAFLLEAQDFSTIKAWEAGMSGIVINDIRRSDGKAYTALTAGRTGSVQPTHTRGSEWDGSTGNDVNTNGPYGVQWAYRHDKFGMVTITAIGGGGTTATATVTRRLPDSLSSVGTFRWSHSAISAAAGWPKVVLLAFGRLIFFTDFEIICSVVGDYAGGSVNFAPFTDSGLLTPDMAFRRRLAISNPVLWAKVDRDVILVGTSDGVHAIRKINSGEIFSSDNIEIVQQPSRGCEPVWPVQIDASTIFVQRGGKKLREGSYSLDSDRYVAPNMNVWQRHILKDGAKQLAFQDEPEELLIAVRGDGLLAVHPHVPEQEVRGFARLQHAGGVIRSACVIPGSSGDGAELWALVERDDDAYRSVEQQAPAWVEEETALDDAFFVDSGATYSGAPTTTISGATHLAGRQVAVLADGAVIPGRSIDALGNLTPALALPASTVQLGLQYAARIKSLRMEVRDNNGNTVQGKRKRIVSIILRVLETVGVKVDPGSGKADELIDRPLSAPMDQPVPPYTGDTTSKSLSGNWDRDAQIIILSDDPLPCCVVAGMPRLEASDR
jgi:hypothetical protein